MKTLTYATVMLAVIAGAAPAMAQSLPPAAPDASPAVQAQPTAVTGAPDPGWAGMPGQVDGMYNAYGQPNQIYGMPGADQASASSHPSE
jgi:hypothetical protein